MEHQTLFDAIVIALLLLNRLWDSFEKWQLKRGQKVISQQIQNVDKKAEVAAETGIKAAEAVTPNDKKHSDWTEEMRKKLLSVLGPYNEGEKK